MNSATQLQAIATEAPAAEIPQEKSLQQHVSEAMDTYFLHLDGQDTSDLYELVMAQVEPPLLASVMTYTRNNQSRAAEILGLNRGTLRKKLKQYNLI